MIGLVGVAHFVSHFFAQPSRDLLVRAATPRTVFLLIAGFMALSAVTIIEVRRRGAPAPARA